MLLLSCPCPLSPAPAQVYSSCPDLATKLLSQLSWEQQVSLCRQRQSRLEGQLEDSRGAVANVTHVS